MKKLVMIPMIVGCMLMTGCGMNQAKCQETVQKEYPNADIKTMPGNEGGFTFLVKMTNGSIWCIRTMNMRNTEITEKLMMFRGE